MPEDSHTIELDYGLLQKLEPVAASLYERHLGMASLWIPSDHIPWERLKDHDPRDEWSEEILPIAKSIRSSLFVNLLTEDNLPYYSRDVEAMTGRYGIWERWAHKWTSEEGRHSIILRDYVIVSGALDPHDLEIARLQQVENAEVPRPLNTLDGIAYVVFQELATRVAHHQTGRHLRSVDEAGYEVMKLVGNDENLHYMFYRDLFAEALKIDQQACMESINRVLRSFKMPGTGIPDFETHSELIAKSGIYGYTEFYNNVVVPTLRNWKIDLEKPPHKGLERYLGVLRRAVMKEKVERQKFALAS